jgi:hypothetical protein
VQKSARHPCSLSASRHSVRLREPHWRGLASMRAFWTSRDVRLESGMFSAKRTADDASGFMGSRPKIESDVTPSLRNSPSTGFGRPAGIWAAQNSQTPPAGNCESAMGYSLLKGLGPSFLWIASFMALSMPFGVRRQSGTRHPLGPKPVTSSSAPMVKWSWKFPSGLETVTFARNRPLSSA